MTGYRELLAQPGVTRLVAAMVAARFGGGMIQLTVVLFVLEHYHSPGLAGLVGLGAGLSGIISSPVAGALLDRYGRVRMIQLDYAVGVATTLLVPGLFWLGLLPAWLLLVVVTLSGLSLPLSASGARSLLPLLLPRSMWDRGNGLDSASWRAAAICGPALAGALVAAFGSSPTMVAVAATWVLAGALLIGLREPRTGLEGARSLLGDALAGLRYLLGNRVLRRLGVVSPINTLSPGALSIALPLLVFTRFHGNAALVGLLWAAMGAGGLAGNLVTGAFRTEGRESRIMALGFAGTGLGMVVVLVAPSAAVAMLGMTLAGLSGGPVDVAMFGLRVRSIERAWFGRAIAISMMLNSLGFPIGAGLGGQLAVRSLLAALVFACLTPLLAAGLSAWLLRPPSQPEPRAVLTPTGATSEP